MSKKVQMKYDEFRKIIIEELTGAPSGLTWSEIRDKRSELYQKVPSNIWVNRMINEEGLQRERVKGKIIWSIS